MPWLRMKQSFTLVRVQPGLPMSSLDITNPSECSPLDIPKPSLPVDSFLSGFSFDFHGGKIVTNVTVASRQQLPHPLGPLSGQRYAPSPNITA